MCAVRWREATGSGGASPGAAAGVGRTAGCGGVPDGAGRGADAPPVAGVRGASLAGRAGAEARRPAGGVLSAARCTGADGAPPVVEEAAGRPGVADLGARAEAEPSRPGLPVGVPVAAGAADCRRPGRGAGAPVTGAAPGASGPGPERGAERRDVAASAGPAARCTAGPGPPSARGERRTGAAGAFGAVGAAGAAGVVGPAGDGRWAVGPDGIAACGAPVTGGVGTAVGTEPYDTGASGATAPVPDPPAGSFTAPVPGECAVPATRVGVSGRPSARRGALATARWTAGTPPAAPVPVTAGAAAGPAVRAAVSPASRPPDTVGVRPVLEAVEAVEAVEVVEAAVAAVAAEAAGAERTAVPAEPAAAPEAPEAPGALVAPEAPEAPEPAEAAPPPGAGGSDGPGAAAPGPPVVSRAGAGFRRVAGSTRRCTPAG